MIGKILAIAALVTLPLSAAMWRKSHVNPEHYRFDLTAYKSMRIYLKGGLCGMRVLSLPTRTNIPSEFRGPLEYDALKPFGSLMLSSARQGPYRITRFVFPLWLSTLLLALCTTTPVINGPVRRFIRRRRGACEECGYDLRGTRGRRCPECGTRFR